MFVPYSTDAPVYHWPVATVGLMVANVAVFVISASEWLSHMPSPGSFPGDPWELTYGQGLRPIEWLLSPFAHGGFWHLVGNMVSLWVFGLVVEGKLGAVRFLPIYLAIAVGQSALEQALMLGATQGSSVGASSAIYGLLAIAAVWAPENDVRFFYWWGLWAGTIEIPLLTVAALYIGWDVTIAVLYGGVLGMGVTSGFLHLMGAAIGAPIGVLLVKRGAVDCEGWDVFSRLARPKKTDPTKAERERLAAEADQRARASQNASAARDQVAAYLAAGNQAAAATLFLKTGGLKGALALEPAALLGVATGLQAAERWPEAGRVLAMLIDAAPQAADPLRLRLAQLCVTKLGRPGRALDLLGSIRAEGLSDAGRDLATKVAKRARAMQKEGVVELDDGGW